MRRRPLLIPACYVCLAMFPLRGVELAPQSICGLVVILGLVAAVAYRRQLFHLSMVSSCLLLALCATSRSAARVEPSDMAGVDGMPARIEGVVSSVVRQNSETTVYVLEGHTDGRDIPCVYVRSLCIEKRPVISAACQGERRIAVGYLSRPAPPALPDEIDERMMAHQRNVSFMVRVASSVRVQEAPWWHRLRSTIHADITATLEASFTPSAAGVVRALALGDRTGVSHAHMLGYQQTGTAHMLSVSGSHVGLIFLLVSILLSRWRGTTMLIVTSTCIMLYVYLTGAESPAVRAAIMGIAALLSHRYERDFDGMNILCGSVLILALADPWGIDTISTVLSISAVAGILVLAPRWLEAAHMLVGRIPSILQAMSVCVAASTSIVVPSMLYFHSVALFSVAANMLVVPLLSAVFVLVPLLLIAAPLGVAAPIAWCMSIIVTSAESVISVAQSFEEMLMHEHMVIVLAFISTAMWWWPLISTTVPGALLRFCCCMAAIGALTLAPVPQRPVVWLYACRSGNIVGYTTPHITKMITVGTSTGRLDGRFLQWTRRRHETVVCEGVGQWGRRMSRRIAYEVVGSKHVDSARTTNRERR